MQNSIQKHFLEIKKALKNLQRLTHTHTHIYIYIHTYWERESAVFAKAEMDNEWNVNFLQNSSFAIQHTVLSFYWSTYLWHFYFYMSEAGLSQFF